jgi:DNA-binding MarR family transcriptional regulator
MELSWVQHRRFSQELADLSLTVPQFYTLNALIDLGGATTMGALSRQVMQVSATMTGIIDRLVRDGLVKRSRCDDDRRAVLVEITPVGRQAVATAWERAFEGTESLLQALSLAEVEATVAVLEALTTLMEQQSPDESPAQS